jgi:hypothetical protein
MGHDGPLLTEIRARELREIDVSAELASMTDVFEYALRTFPPRTTSGLVEQQRLFARLPR